MIYLKWLEISKSTRSLSFNLLIIFPGRRILLKLSIKLASPFFVGLPLAFTAIGLRVMLSLSSNSPAYQDLLKFSKTRLILLINQTSSFPKDLRRYVSTDLRCQQELMYEKENGAKSSLITAIMCEHGRPAIKDVIREHYNMMSIVSSRNWLLPISILPEVCTFDGSGAACGSSVHLIIAALRSSAGDCSRALTIKISIEEKDSIYEVFARRFSGPASSCRVEKTEGTRIETGCNLPVLRVSGATNGETYPNLLQ